MGAVSKIGEVAEEAGHVPWNGLTVGTGSNSGSIIRLDSHCPGRPEGASGRHVLEAKVVRPAVTGSTGFDEPDPKNNHPVDLGVH